MLREKKEEERAKEEYLQQLEELHRQIKMSPRVLPELSDSQQCSCQVLQSTNIVGF